MKYTFRFIAVGALVSTVAGCGIIMVKEGVDAADKDSCYYNFNLVTNETAFEVNRPAPSSPLDFGKGCKLMVCNKPFMLFLQRSAR